jgi:hypothetical protein
MDVKVSQKILALASFLRKEGLDDASEQASSLIETSAIFTRRLQEALTRAGFSVRADGNFGEKTRQAVISFKELAKSEGLYSGEIDSQVSLAFIKSVESFDPHKWFSEEELGEKEGFTLYVGDSQMEGSLGKALMSRSEGEYKVTAQRSTTPAYWSRNSKFKNLLKKGPSKIVVSLNGNGNIGAAKFIQTILTYAGSDVPVFWTGAPPPIYRPKSNMSKVTTPKRWYDHYIERKEWNNQVKTMIPGSWIFVDPYDHIRYNEPKETEGYTVASGYECSGCDGVHLPKDVAEQYASQIVGYI